MIGGLVGLFLLLLAFIFFLRWYRRRRESGEDWDTVQRQIHSVRIPIQTPPPQHALSPTPTASAYYSPNTSESGHSSNHGLLHPSSSQMTQTNISPRLIVNTNYLTPQGVYTIDESDLESATEDPFADPYAKMRSRPYIPSVSPTIRPLDPQPPQTNPFADPKASPRDVGLTAIGTGLITPKSPHYAYPSPSSSASTTTPTTRNRFSKGSESIYSTDSTPFAANNVSGDTTVRS